MKPAARMLRRAAQVHELMNKAMNLESSIEAECAWQKIMDEHLSKAEMLRSSKEWREKASREQTASNKEARAEGEDESSRVTVLFTDVNIVARVAQAELAARDKSEPDWLPQVDKCFRNFYRLVLKWYNDRRKYWRCYASSNTNFDAVGSQGGELMNAALKKERSYMKLNSVLAMLNQLTLRHEFHDMVANWRQRNSVLICPGSDSLILEQTLLFSVTTWAVTKLMEQYALAVQDRYEFVRIEVERAGAEQWHTANSKGSQVHVNLDDLTKPCYSCGWPSQMLLRCRHVIAAELRKGQSTQELASSLLQYVAPRWLITTLILR